MGRGIASATLAVALWVGIPRAAFAGDITCAWNIATEAQHDALIARAGGDEGAPHFTWDRSQVDRIIAECHYNFRNADRSSKAITPAVGAYAVELLGASQLSREFGIGTKKVDLVWSGLAPSERNTMAAFNEAPISTAQSAGVNAADTMVKLLMELGLNTHDPNASGAVFNYLSGKISREQYEAQF